MCTDQLMSASIKCNISCRVKDIKDLLSQIEQRHNVKAKCTKLNLLNFLNGRKRKNSQADHTLLTREEQGFL